MYASRPCLCAKLAAVTSITRETCRYWTDRDRYQAAGIRRSLQGLPLGYSGLRHASRAKALRLRRQNLLGMLVEFRATADGGQDKTNATARRRGEPACRVHRATAECGARYQCYERNQPDQCVERRRRVRRRP